MGVIHMELWEQMQKIENWNRHIYFWDSPTGKYKVCDIDYKIGNVKYHKHIKHTSNDVCESCPLKQVCNERRVV